MRLHFLDVGVLAQVRGARIDWELIKELATELGDERWQNRALAQIGITAFYDRDLETASKNVAVAAAKAAEIHDIGGQIRFTTVLGLAYSGKDVRSRASLFRPSVGSCQEDSRFWVSAYYLRGSITHSGGIEAIRGRTTTCRQNAEREQLKIPKRSAGADSLLCGPDSSCPR